MELALTPTFKGNGMALDNDGNLLVCEQVSSCLVRFNADGARELVAFHYGARISTAPTTSSPAARDGSIYFTDPDYGRWNDWIGCERSRDGLDFRGLFRVPPDGGELELCRRSGRVRRAERAVLLTGRIGALRQRLAGAEVKVVRRRRRRCACQRPTPSRRHRQRSPARGERRRDGVRRARQHLGHRPGRRLGADARRRAPRDRPCAGGRAAASRGAARICARCSS